MNEPISCESPIRCDHCKFLLDSPVIIPCGLNICEKHVNGGGSGGGFSFSPCFFCGETHPPPFSKNLKLKHQVDRLNAALAADASLRSRLVHYDLLAQKPAEAVAHKFASLEREIIAERNRIKTHFCQLVDHQASEYLKRVSETRQACLSGVAEVAARGAGEPLANEARAKLKIWSASLRPDKVAEAAWAQVAAEASSLSEALARQTAEMSTALFRGKDYSFYSKNITPNAFEFGQVVISEHCGPSGQSNAAAK